MKLSIIIPTYNVEEYIEECLNSLLPQLGEDCELIIVDDSSTDQTAAKVLSLITPEMISRYSINKEAENYFKFYMRKENKGVSSSRNLGLKVATGEYVAFIDADDIVDEKYIKNIFAAIKSGKDYYKLSWKRFGVEPTTYLAKHLPGWNCSVWSRVFKRSIIEHEFDEALNYAEDLKFMNENITSKMKCGYIDEPIYKYRAGRKGSLSDEQR